MANLNLGQDVASFKRERENKDSRSYQVAKFLLFNSKLQLECVVMDLFLTSTSLVVCT